MSGPSCLLDGSAATSHTQVLPSGYWWSLLYGTVIGLLCLVVCLVGAHIYAKTTFIIFLVVMLALLTIFISFFAVRPRVVPLPGSALPSNGTGPVFPTTANFTGFKLDTLKGNLMGKITFLSRNANFILFSSPLTNLQTSKKLIAHHNKFRHVQAQVHLSTIEMIFPGFTEGWGFDWSVIRSCA